MPKHRPWTDAEIRLLLDLDKRRVPYKNRNKFFTGRSQDAIRNKTWELKNAKANDWLDQERIGILDIETTGFDADTGFMISWCLKIHGGKILKDVIKRSECINRDKLDKRITRSLITAIAKNVDVLVTYNGTRFDIPFLRTRALIHGIPIGKLLPFGSKKHIDMFYRVRNKLKLGRSSQRRAVTMLGLHGKHDVDITIWMDAKLGYKDALDEVLKHNIDDVKGLEQLFDLLRPFSKSTRRSM